MCAIHKRKHIFPVSTLRLKFDCNRRFYFPRLLHLILEIGIRYRKTCTFIRWPINVRPNIPSVRATTSSFMGFHYSTKSSKLNYESPGIEKLRHKF